MRVSRFFPRRWGTGEPNSGPASLPRHYLAQVPRRLAPLWRAPSAPLAGSLVTGGSLGRRGQVPGPGRFLPRPSPWFRASSRGAGRGAPGRPRSRAIPVAVSYCHVTCGAQSRLPPAALTRAALPLPNPSGFDLILREEQAHPPALWPVVPGPRECPQNLSSSFTPGRSEPSSRSPGTPRARPRLRRRRSGTPHPGISSPAARPLQVMERGPRGPWRAV